MSRIGRYPIQIPDKTEVTVADGVVSVKGPLGELRRPMGDEVTISIADKQVVLEPKNETPKVRALWGTYASHIKNMVQGVNEPFVKRLSVEGIGYRVALNGKTLTLSVGFSHPVEVSVPDDITVAVEKNVITVSGVDKERVGQFAADVRAVKKPEPYKGKGVRYEGEQVRLKQGKKAVG